MYFLLKKYIFHVKTYEPLGDRGLEAGGREFWHNL